MAPPPADIHIDAALAQQLLADQHAAIADLPLQLLAEGWDNVMFRLGDELVVRIPRRHLAAQLIEHEQRWLPELAPHLPIPIPAPARCGTPTDYYPYNWSVVPWQPGDMALNQSPEPHEARRLGDFLRALHNIAVPHNPPLNPHRGGALHSRRELYAKRLEAASGALGATTTTAVQRLLTEALAVPLTEPATWLHGDLHSKNVIVERGAIQTIIDWGDICTGDPATDLASAWIMFDPEEHHRFWDEYGSVSEGLTLRSKAWAIAFGLMLYDSHHEADPTFAEAGLTTIRRAVLVT